MTPERTVSFGRREDLSSLYRDAFLLYTRHLGLWLLVGAAVSVPVELILTGVGLGRIAGPYDPTLGNAATAVSVAGSYVISAPLVAAMTVAGLLEVRAGRAPSARRAIQAGLEAFPRMLPAVLLAAVGSLVGVLALILPGIYLAVRWYFVPQAVLVDGSTTALGPLRRSAEVVSGSWWRTFAVIILTLAILLLPALLVLRPFEALAEAADSDALSLAGDILFETLTGPFVAIVSTLLYLDLRERHDARAA